MDLKSKIILIYGPTASGKSSFAINLAKKINGEIVNADSMQIYNDLKILTARPTKKDFKQIKHHLYGIQSGKKSFSTGDWLKLAIKKIQEIKNKKKVPILVGGTGLYFKALVDGLVEIPNLPLTFRNKIRNLQKKIGQKKFYNKLLKIDPLLIGKINPTDVQRSIRAYEVKLFTKKSITEWFEGTKSQFKKKEFYKVILDFPRVDLIDRINKRAIQMFKMGADLEVKKFLKLKIDKSKSISKAIGVSEINEYLKKNIDEAEAIEKISIKTRQYAKRQMTWARGHMSNWKKLNPNRLNNFLKKIKKDKKYYLSKKDIMLIESIKSDGIEISKKYEDLYEINESEMPTDIQVMINNNEIGSVVLRIIEVIGQDDFNNLDEDTLYFVISALNQLDIDYIRNKILLKVLPLKV